MELDHKQRIRRNKESESQGNKAVGGIGGSRKGKKGLNQDQKGQEKEGLENG